MTHEADIQARLQRMVTRDRNGANALILLSCLILFSDKFQGAVAPAVAPQSMSREECRWAFASLRSWGFLQKEPHRWYWFDESLRQVISPHPETIAQLYKHYARRYKALQTPRKRWSSLEWFKLQVDIQAIHWGFDHDSESEIPLGLFLMRESSIPDDENHHLIEKAYQAAHQLGTAQAQTQAFRHIAFVAKRIHHYAIGYKACEHALNLYKQFGHVHDEIQMFSTLGELAEHNEDYGLARTCWEHVIAFYAAKEITTPRFFLAMPGQIDAFAHLRNVAAKQGDHETALDCLKHASQRVHRYGEWRQSLHLLKMAKGAQGIKQFDAARSLYSWALNISQRINNFKCQFETLEEWGKLEQEDNNPTTAKSLWLLLLSAMQHQADMELETTNPTYRESLEAKMDELRETYGLMDA